MLPHITRCGGRVILKIAQAGQARQQTVHIRMGEAQATVACDVEACERLGGQCRRQALELVATNIQGAQTCIGSGSE